MDERIGLVKSIRQVKIETGDLSASSCRTQSLLLDRYLKELGTPCFPLAVTLMVYGGGKIDIAGANPYVDGAEGVDGWNGHLVCIVDIDGYKLIDMTMNQTRIEVPYFIVPAPNAFISGDSILSTVYEEYNIIYAPHPADNSYVI